MADETATGATETISASVPSELVKRIRDRVGKRGFSQFVTQSLKRELLRQSRLELVAEFEQHSGPVDEAAVEEIVRALRQ
jgi:hypothetical protein